MQYDRFDDLITRKYGIVVKNWPLKRFCNPSAAATRIELELLLHSWESGTTRFQKLSQDEMRAWENDHFSSRLAMMSLPSTPADTFPTPPLVPPAPDPISSTDSTSMQPPGLAPPIPTLPGMILFSELPRQGTELQPACGDARQGVAPILPPAIQSPTPNSELVAQMIRLDPTLESIDPALIMAGIAQGHHLPASGIPTVNLERSPPPAPPAPQNKRTRGAFEIVTPMTFNTRTTKKPRKERKGGKAKENIPVMNIPSVEGSIVQ